MKKRESYGIIEIKDAKINVNKIIEEIRKQIGIKKIAYLKELGQNLPSALNMVENSEFLLDGWYESDIIGGQRARWTKGEFSFLFNSDNQDKISLEIVATPPGVAERPLKLDFYIDNEAVGKNFISSSRGQIVNITLPDKFIGKNITVLIKLDYTFCPAQLTKGGDIRNLGVAVSQISNMSMTESGSKYIPELVGYETILSMQSERARLHANPESFLPKGTKLRFFKMLILRGIKVFTAVQVTFNYYVAELFKNVLAQEKILTRYITEVDMKTSVLREQISSINTNAYKSLYWDKHKDKYYEFHQNAFRGTENNVKENLRAYLKYLKTPGFYANKPFVDFGSGRGEFLEVLKENKISAIGVDTNEVFVKESEAKGLTVTRSDALGYLISNTGQIGGASAIHLVEHFTFPQLFDFIYLINERLVKGGVVIFETPNPDNLMVGAEHFYNDFSHITKLPPLLLMKTMEFVGFKEVKMLSLHPEKKEYANSEIEKRLYGPMDYALIAIK